MIKKLKILVACEESQTVTIELRKLGHEAYSCDLIECSGGYPEWHIQGDAVKTAYLPGWDMMIAHPPCTRLANSGVRWLTNEPPQSAPKEATKEEQKMWSAYPVGVKFRVMWRLFDEGVNLYLALRNAPIEKIAIENPVMHKYARELIEKNKRNITQPWWFGDKAFKATGFELINLPELIEGEDSLRAELPKPNTEEWKDWSKCHRMSPGPERAKLRSKTYPGTARAIALQWAGRLNQES